MGEDQAPPPAKRKRGRPPGKAGAKSISKAKRQLVRIMAAEELPLERIALALNITVDQLRKRCSVELTTTKDLLNAEVIAKLFETATAASAKERDAFRAQEFWVRCNAGWHEFTPKPWQPPAPPREADEPKPEKLGKKDQAKKDAQETPKAGGWAGLVN